MSKRNDLRISFSEWLYRMSEGDVPYQARALAVYAVAFKVTSNEELACLVGMDTKGIADKTYNKWKRYLSDNGWVIVRQVTVGRQTTIEVDPAFKEAPVTFTDMVRRGTRKFSGSSPVTITDTPSVEITGEAVKVTDETQADDTQDAREPAHTPAGDNTSHGNTESSSRILTSEELASKLASFLDAHAEKTSGDQSQELAGLNGSAEPMIDDILSWLNPPATRTNARKWLAGTLRTFGQDVTAQSYHKLKTDMMTGGLVAKPLQTWVTIAQRMKAEPAKPTRPEKGISRLKEKFLRAGE